MSGAPLLVDTALCAHLLSPLALRVAMLFTCNHVQVSGFSIQHNDLRDWLENVAANQEHYSIMGCTRDKMDPKKDLEESFREMCCIGNLDKARILVERGVNINSANTMNGWTALHWAAKRGHKNIVEFLVREGADTTVLTTKGELSAQLTSDANIREMLGGTRDNTPTAAALPIVPNYLRNPEFFYAQKCDFTPEPERVEVTKEGLFSLSQQTGNPSSRCKAESKDELVLKLRVADSDDPDFFEVELQRSLLTYQNLTNVCCEELDIRSDRIKKIRKLPNTVLRKDKDVMRLQPFQELEIVLNED